MVSKGLTIHNNYHTKVFTKARTNKVNNSHTTQMTKSTPIYRYAPPITIIPLRVSTNKHQPTLKLKDVLIRQENTKHWTQSKGRTGDS